jgi:hypothetical protein
VEDYFECNTRRNTHQQIFIQGEKDRDEENSQLLLAASSNHAR